jgi:hypothetical protein
VLILLGKAKSHAKKQWCKGRKKVKKDGGNIYVFFSIAIFFSLVLQVAKSHATKIHFYSAFSLSLTFL